MEKILFRNAQMSDCQILYEWRNDPDTRKNSIDTREVSLVEHKQWLEKSLSNVGRQLFIAVLNDQNVGTVRLDRKTDSWELSWTVAPSFRGQGLGKVIVSLAAQLVTEPVTATIKSENSASKKIAIAAGFTCTSERDGLSIWTKESK